MEFLLPIGHQGKLNEIFYLAIFIGCFFLYFKLVGQLQFSDILILNVFLIATLNSFDADQTTYTQLENNVISVVALDLKSGSMGLLHPDERQYSYIFQCWFKILIEFLKSVSLNGLHTLFQSKAQDKKNHSYNGVTKLQLREMNVALVCYISTQNFVKHDRHIPFCLMK